MADALANDKRPQAGGDRGASHLDRPGALPEDDRALLPVGACDHTGVVAPQCQAHVGESREHERDREREPERKEHEAAPAPCAQRHTQPDRDHRGGEHDAQRVFAGRPVRREPPAGCGHGRCRERQEQKHRRARERQWPPRHDRRRGRRGGDLSAATDDERRADAGQKHDQERRAAAPDPEAADPGGVQDLADAASATRPATRATSTRAAPAGCASSCAGHAIAITT